MSHSHANPPGQPAIRYRLGTQAGFFREMLSRIRNESSLAPLTIRTPDDPAIALLDAWAMAADVLCFYQERIANESFLRTARDPRSLMAFAEQLGHQPGTGVAAGVLLAFKVEEIPEAPGPVRLAPGLQVQSIPGPDEQPQIFETVEPLEARPEWNEMKMAVPQPKRTPRAPDWKKREIYLAGIGLGLAPGDALLLWEGSFQEVPKLWRLVFLDSVKEDSENASTTVRWTKVYDAAGGFQEKDLLNIVVFRTRALLFGHNAADWRLIPKEVRDKYCKHGECKKFADCCNEGKEWPRFNQEGAKKIFLDRIYSEVSPERLTLLLEEAEGNNDAKRLLLRPRAVLAEARADFGLAGQVTLIITDVSSTEKFNLRRSVVYAAPEPLKFQEKVESVGAWHKREIDLASPLPPLQAGRTVIVQGRDTGENLVIARRMVLHSTNRRLTLDRELDVALDPATVTVFGNVAHATHGETVEEVLGSGAPEPTSQRFPLQQGPLTYLSSASRTGRRSTLEIRVDGVPWREVPSLHGHGPCDRVYTARTDALGTPWVCFGDGKTGAALPFGEDNVTASYRIGLGLAGNVAANSLTVLLTSPLGALEVTNPLPASGGAGPERLTPGDLPVIAQTRTLGRLVSTADFEDFARGFAGIAKARAVAVGRTVVLTIAPSGGAAFGPELAQDLLRAMAERSAPGIAVQVEGSEIIGFRVKAVIGVAPGLPFLPVKSAAERALAGAFSFDQRELGQAVHEQDVAAILRTVRGVEIATSIKIERLTPPSTGNGASLWLLTETDLRDYEGTTHA
jgi:hypothetical protein